MAITLHILLIKFSGSQGSLFTSHDSLFSYRSKNPSRLLALFQLKNMGLSATNKNRKGQTVFFPVIIIGAGASPGSSGRREREAMSSRRGPPKHQNQYAWNPNAGHKKNETELGGKYRPYSDITCVCPRCKDQIDWKRRYGKYKPLMEPAKCQKCGKRAVRQAYHNICSACAKDLHVCAKCCCRTNEIIGRDISEVETERKSLEVAIKNSRERDRRTLLRAMNKDKAAKGASIPKIADRSREGELFAATSINEYAEHSGQHDSDEEEDEDFICD